MASRDTGRDPTKTAVADRVFIGGLIFIFGVIVLHAPLSVYFGTAFPAHALVIKAWKEILMGVLAVLAAVCVTRRHAWRIIGRDPVVLSGAIMAVLYVISVNVGVGTRAYGAGLLIDIRYVLYAVLVLIAARLYPGFRRPFLIAGLAGACVVVGFGLLQFVLPKNFLASLGYSAATIAPYTTIDSYEGLVRLQSTLRGPNPLGAYALVVALVAGVMAVKAAMSKSRRWGLGILAVLSAVLVLASYSRSAYLGLAVGAAVACSMIAGKKRLLTVKAGVIAIAVIILVVAGLSAIRGTTFYAGVFTHEVAGSGPAVNSNAGHEASVAAAWAGVIAHPLGYGTGSTGSASLLSGSATIVENQYLFVAHEAGWGALVLFAGFVAILLRRAYRRRTDPLALAVFASGIGLLIVGLVLPVFADDTVSIVWFGLAGLVAGTARTKGGDGDRTAE